MDTALLAFCFVAMGVLVLAWSLLPHAAPVAAYRAPEVAPAIEPVISVQAA